MSDVMGRPPVLDEQKKRDIITAITTGAPRQVAADYVGCHVETIRRAAARDPEFAEQLSRAEANSQMTPIGAIREAAQKDWRAAAWALERYFPNRYGKRDPETMTREQINQVTKQYAEEIVEAIQNPKLRSKLQRRLDKLAHQISKHVTRQADEKKTNV